LKFIETFPSKYGVKFIILFEIVPFENIHHISHDATTREAIPTPVKAERKIKPLGTAV
jgi:hypothetical protein